MKKLRASYSNIEEIPGRFRDHYRAEGDLWVLDIEPTEGFELGDVAGAKADADRYWNALETRIRDTAIDAAVSAAGGDIFLLSPHVARHLKVDPKTFDLRVVDADGRRVYTEKGTAKTAVDIVAELAADKSFARAFAPAGQAAATKETRKPINLTERLAAVKAERDRAKAVPNIQGNPFLRTNWNLTNQLRLIKADPTRAAMLRAEAEGAPR